MRKTVSYQEGWEHHLPRSTGADNRQQRARYLHFLQAGMEVGITPRQREALLLHYEQGLTVQQVAQQLHICPSSASRRISGGLLRLRRLADLCEACHFSSSVHD